VSAIRLRFPVVAVTVLVLVLVLILVFAIIVFIFVTELRVSALVLIHKVLPKTSLRRIGGESQRAGWNRWDVAKARGRVV